MREPVEGLPKRRHAAIKPGTSSSFPTCRYWYLLIVGCVWSHSVLDTSSFSSENGIDTVASLIAVGRVASGPGWILHSRRRTTVTKDMVIRGCLCSSRRLSLNLSREYGADSQGSTNSL